MFKKLLEGALVLQQRHAQVAGVEKQAGPPGVEAPRTGEDQVVLGDVRRFAIGEGGFLQPDALADQPAAKAVPDDQQAFDKEVVRVRRVT